MIKEAYVSFETAKLLKDKGFNVAEIDACVPYVYYSNGKMDFYDDDNPIFVCEAVTHQVAMAWLREAHGIDIVITPSMFRKKYNVCIYKDENLCCIDFDGATLAPSYEYACEAAIKYCLENLI